MEQSELAEKVADLCTDAGLDFLFVLENESSYSVNANSCDQLRRLATMHEKLLYATEQEFVH